VGAVRPPDPGLPGPRGLPGPHRRWLVVNAVLVSACVNLVVNAVIAWVSVMGADTVPLWSASPLGGPSILTDTVATLFLLPLITCLLCTTSVWLELRSGRLDPLDGPGAVRSLLGPLPAGRLRRGLAFGAGSTLLLGPPSVGVILALPVDELSAPAFVIYKVVFAIGLGVLVTPVIAVRAMADPPPPAPYPRPPAAEGHRDSTS
jgi:hypothetical protein